MTSTDREPVTAILEGGDLDGTEVAIPAPEWAVRQRGVVCIDSTDGRYNLLTDDYGQPMRDVFGRYRYRVQW